MPLPQPNSWGSIPQGMPDFKTKTIPVKAARSAMVRGRPPFGLGGSGGKIGATISHSLSLISGVLMPPIYHTAQVLLGALREALRFILVIEIYGCLKNCMYTGKRQSKS